jgi:peroxiredoxin
MTANTAISIPRLILPIGVTALLLCASAPALDAAEIPKVGDKAPDFSLKSLDDQSVRLSELTAKGSVVLVVLRGWPGYQCPICDRQVQDFIRLKTEFGEAKSKIVFIYPGPADGLKAHAQEFKDWKNREWPAEFLYVLDPDYTMVNAYGLRWDAPRETAYASTFVLDGKGVVTFAKTSRTHGGRTKAADMLVEVKKISVPK